MNVAPTLNRNAVSFGKETPSQQPAAPAKFETKAQYEKGADKLKTAVDEVVLNFNKAKASEALKAEEKSSGDDIIKGAINALKENLGLVEKGTEGGKKVGLFATIGVAVGTLILGLLIGNKSANKSAEAPAAQPTQQA